VGVVGSWPTAGTWTQHEYWTLLSPSSQFWLLHFQNFIPPDEGSKNTVETLKLKFDFQKLKFDVLKISDVSTTFFDAFFRTEPKGLTAESKVHVGPKCQQCEILKMQKPKLRRRA
jgi:hypothetical protein